MWRSTSSGFKKEIRESTRRRHRRRCGREERNERTGESQKSNGPHLAGRVREKENERGSKTEMCFCWVSGRWSRRVITGLVRRTSSGSIPARQCQWDSYLISVIAVRTYQTLSFISTFNWCFLWSFKFFFFSVLFPLNCPIVYWRD